MARIKLVLYITALVCKVVQLQSYSDTDTDVIGPETPHSKWTSEIQTEDNAHSHHVSKREAQPAAVTFSLTRYGYMATENNIKVGDVVSHKLTITVRSSGEIEMTVKLTGATIEYEDRTWAILSICNPRIHAVGANIENLIRDNIVGVMSDSGGDGRHNKAEVYLGRFTRVESSSDQTDDRITILFETLVNFSPGFTHGEDYRLDVLVEYGEETWNTSQTYVGESLHVTLWSATEPSFTVTGPDILMKGTVGTWTLAMTLWDATNVVIVDVFLPLNQRYVVFVGRIGISSRGDSYSCYPEDGTAVFSIIDWHDETRDGGQNHVIARLDFGDVVNSKFRSDVGTTEDNTIRVEINALLYNDSNVMSEILYYIGVAVSLDDVEVYSTQHNFMALDTDLETGSTLPSIRLAAAHGTVVWGQPTTFYVNFTIPNNTQDTYYAELSLPINGSAVITFCPDQGVSPYYVGHNFLFTNTPTVDYGAAGTGAQQSLYDTVSANYAIITNTGSRLGADVNTFVLEFRGFVVECHENVTSGDNVSISAGVKIGNATIWVGDVTVTISDDPEPPTEEPEIKHYSAMNDRDESILYQGGSTAEIIAIRIPPASILRNVNITVKSSEVDESPVIGFCALDILQYGSMIHQDCLSMPIDTTWTNTTRRVSKTDDFVISEATVILDWVINGAYGNYWWNVNETTIYVLVNVLATSHPSLTDASEVTFDVFVDVGGDSIVNKTITLTYQADDSDTAESDDAPYIQLLINEMNMASVGGVVPHELHIYTTPRTVTKYTVEVETAANSPLSICRIATKSTGANVSCIIDDYEYAAVYQAYYNSSRIDECSLEDEADGHCIASLYSTASLDLGNVANFGQEPRDGNVDPGTLIEVFIFAQFHEDMTGGISPGDSSSYSVGVYNGLDSLYVDTASILLDPSRSMTPSATNPQCTIEKYTNETDISRGSGAVFHVKVYAPFYSSSNYSAEMHSPLTTSTTDTSMARIAAVNVIDAGWNVPCLNDKHVVSEYQATGSGQSTHDTATMTLGKVTNFFFPFDDTPLVHDDNMFTIEVVVCVPEDSAAGDGQSLAVSADITVDSDDHACGTVNYAVSDDLLPTETSGYIGLAFAESYTTPTVRFGEEVERKIYISMDMVTADITIDIETPMDGVNEVLLTTRRPHVSNIGKNFPCHQDLLGTEPPVDSDRTYGGTQDELVEVSVGRVTNTAKTVRSQFEYYSPQDDVIELTYYIVASQHVNNTNVLGVNQEYVIYLTRDRETLFDVNLTDTITIETTSYEPTPDMQLFVNINDTVPTSVRNPGDAIAIDVRFNHTENSTGHAFLAELKIFAPNFMQYDTHDGLPFITYSAFGITTSEENSRTVQMPEIYFTDNETLTVNYTIDPNNVLERGQTVHVVMPINLVYYGKNVLETTTSDLYDVMSFIEFDVTVPECTDALGMESRAISDCKIRWSSALDGFNGTKSRLNSNSGWKPGLRGEPFLGEEYLQVTFGNETRVTGVSLQPAAGTTDWVVTFKMQYSTYGKRWFTVQDETIDDDKIWDISNHISTAVDNTVFVQFTGSEVIEARYVRFVPQSDSDGNNAFGVRLEFHGCTLTGDLPDTCEADTARSSSLYRDVYERGWLMDTTAGHLYVCILSEIADYVSCSHTQDFGTSWESIDEEIVNINFLRSDTNQLYGLARNQLSVMRSDDWGENWLSVSEEEYNDAETANGVITVKRLPFEDWSQTTLALLNAEFGFDFNSTIRWTVSMDGVNKMVGGSWSLVSYWSTEEWDFT